MIDQIEAAAEEMGIEPSALAEKIAGDITQMQQHEARRPQGGPEAATQMLSEELGLEAGDDLKVALLAFIAEHGDVDSMSRDAQAQFAADLGDRAEGYGLTFNDYHSSRTR